MCLIGVNHLCNSRYSRVQRAGLIGPVRCHRQAHNQTGLIDNNAWFYDIDLPQTDAPTKKQRLVTTGGSTSNRRDIMTSKTADEIRSTRQGSAPSGNHCILQTAVPSPLNRVFDYLPPTGCDPTTLRPGMRVRVPFGRSSRIGLIIAISDTSTVEPDKLKAALDILDEEPLLPGTLLTLLDWTMRYYHHAPGNVISNALPTLLRQGHPARPAQTIRWCLSDAGRAVNPDSLTRAPRQRQLLQLLARHHDGVTAEVLESLGSWRPTMKALVDKGWVERQEIVPEIAIAAVADTDWTTPEHTVTLNPAQQQAVTAIAFGQGGACTGMGHGRTPIGLAHAQVGIEEILFGRFIAIHHLDGREVCRFQCGSDAVVHITRSIDMIVQ